MISIESELIKGPPVAVLHHGGMLCYSILYLQSSDAGHSYDTAATARFVIPLPRIIDLPGSMNCPEPCPRLRTTCGCIHSCKRQSRYRQSGR
jgi:hypothetical protein